MSRKSGMKRGRIAITDPINLFKMLTSRDVPSDDCEEVAQFRTVEDLALYIWQWTDDKNISRIERKIIAAL